MIDDTAPQPIDGTHGAPLTDEGPLPNLHFAVARDRLGDGGWQALRRSCRPVAR